MKLPMFPPTIHAPLREKYIIVGDRVSFTGTTAFAAQKIQATSYETAHVSTNNTCASDRKVYYGRWQGISINYNSCHACQSDRLNRQWFLGELAWRAVLVLCRTDSSVELARTASLV